MMSRVKIAAILRVCVALLLLAQAAAAEVVRIDVRRRDDYGTHERIIGRVHYAIDPKAPANRRIADIQFAPTNDRGLVEFSGDVLFFRPKNVGFATTRGTVFLEVVNRGRDQSLAVLSEARQSSLEPEQWSLGDRFLLEQGFTVAFLGWQFDVEAGDGLTFEAPVAPVEGIVRTSIIETQPGERYAGYPLAYCVPPEAQAGTTVTFRTRIDEPPRALTRDEWQFANNGCVVRIAGGLKVGIHEAIYQARGSPVAGLGMAAVRDFASYLRYGAANATLRESPTGLQRVIGYGYSQSARFLRDFVEDGFNADDRGRPAFDGLMISSAGAGGGSFNHRFAMPGVAGNSVLSALSPVDIPPFTDDALLAATRAAGAVPKIFYTFTASEYWARAGSLTHTSDDGMKDVPLAATSRLYFMAGTPHASGGLFQRRPFRQFANFASQQWTGRALVMALDAWVREGTEPPPSVYPTIAKAELVPRAEVRFPKIPSFPFATYMPQVWRMDYGPRFEAERIITREPPALGEPYRVLVPQVDADGNDLAGIRVLELAVPLGTYTGWNILLPEARDVGYLSGLVGSFEPFALTKAARESQGDPRPSIEERFAGREQYLVQARQAAQRLVAQRFMLQTDMPAAIERSAALWDAIVKLQGPRP